MTSATPTPLSGSVASLPASWYYDPEIFARERKAIFARNWCVLARETELSEAGSYISGEVAGWPVFVVRGEDGELRAFHNVCRHRASPVVTDTAGQCEQLRCPYHGWLYGLDGTLRFAPGFKEGDRLRSTEMGLLAIRCATWNGIVFVCLHSQSEDLETWLGDIIPIARQFPRPADMKFNRALSNEGNVNWKAYSDNSAEGYHLGSIHGELSRSLIRDRTNIAAYENGKFIGFDVVYRASENQPESNGFWVYKFPGLLLHFSDHGFNLERVIPLSPTRTRMERWFWFPESHPDSHCDMQDTIAFSNRVMDEDLGICLRVPKNLQAGAYDTGLLSLAQEPGTIYFQKLVREAVEAVAASE